MVIQAVNRKALRKYEQFRSAIETVRIVLEETEPVIKSMQDHSDSLGGWLVPDKKEVLVAFRRALDVLDSLRAEAKKWEKELVSRGWRV